MLIKQAAQFDSSGAESAADDGRWGMMCYGDYSYSLFALLSPRSVAPLDVSDTVKATPTMAEVYLWSGGIKSVGYRWIKCCLTKTY